MKKAILLSILIAAIAGGVYSARHASESRRVNPYANLPREKVERMRFVETAEEMGILAAEKVVTIQPPFSGRIVKMVEDGARVEQGEPVAWMDIELVYSRLEDRINMLRTYKVDLENKIQDIRMGLESDFLDLQTAAASLEFSQIELLDVNRELLTLETLKESELVSQREVDASVINSEASKLSATQSDLSYRKQYNKREAEKLLKSLSLEKIKYSQNDAMSRIAEEQAKLDQAEILAPISGIFLPYKRWDFHRGGSTTVSIGDNIDDDETLGTIPDLSSLIVRTQIREALITRVQQGITANISFDAFPDIKMTGKIVNIGLSAIERQRSPAGQLSETVDYSGQKVFEVTIKPDSIDERLRPEMTANVSIVLDEKENAIAVPLKCIFNKGGWKVAYVATETGYRVQKVVLGQRNRTQVIVREGLNEGDEVFPLDLEPAKNLGEEGDEKETPAPAAPGPPGIASASA